MRKARYGKVHEECGVFGIYSVDGHDVARTVYYGLYALQHRGQESAGMAVNDEGTIVYHKDMGLVPEVFNDIILNHLRGKAAIGHVLYSSTGGSYRENAQPMVIRYRSGQLALAHNGSLVNATALRDRMEESGAVFQSTNDSEVMLNLISRYSIVCDDVIEAIKKMMQEVRGSYSLVMLTPELLIGVRDPLGIRPLCIGKLDNSWVLASESCAFDAIGATFIRDVNPGEIVVIDEHGISSFQTGTGGSSRLCIFEFIYFARPDSFIDGVSVHQSRIEAGKLLATEHPVEADLVIGAPDSGLTAAMGYSEQSGIPDGQGLLKNRYVGRTFIKPQQNQREDSVRIKFNAMKSVVNGKKLVMIDDSIVRGTTTRRIIQMLKNAGAKEVHMRVSSPPMRYPCYFGVDIPNEEQLVAANYSVEEIRQMIGADSLCYLSLEGLLKTPVGARCGFCTACFDARYPIEIPSACLKGKGRVVI